MRALRAFCNAISAQTCQALGVVGTRRGRGHKPPWSRSGWQEAADKTAEQLRVWAGCGEGDANSRCRFDDAGSDFDEMQLQRLELGDLTTPLIFQTAPNTFVNSGCCSSMAPKHSISGRSRLSGMVGIRS